MTAITFEKMTDRQEIANKLMADTGDTVYSSKETLANRVLDAKINGVVAKFTEDNGNTFIGGFVLYDKNILLEGFTFLEGQRNNLLARFTNHLITEEKLDTMTYQLNENNAKMEFFFKTAVEKPFQEN